MSSSSDQAEYKDLAEKIQQFLSHQVETNGSLNDAAKESLAVANECIEQAYNFQQKPASRELLDAYKAFKSAPTSQPAAASGPNQMPPVPDPAQLITNLASSLFSQVGSSFVGAAASAANAASQPQHQQQPQQETTATSAQAQQPSQQQQPSAPPKTRKNVSEAEKLAAESFKNQGNDSMRQDKYKEAYDYYTRAINIDNNNAVYYCNRAAASSKLEDHQAALDDCLEAIEIDSSYCKAYGRMGLAYASMENHQKAKEAYLKAVELDPTNESYRNNLQIAEAKLMEAQNGGAGIPGAGGAGGPNVVNMLRSMMSNPEVMSMAMRSLQDPRVQSIFGLGGQGGQGGQNPNQPR